MMKKTHYYFSALFMASTIILIVFTTTSFVTRRPAVKKVIQASVSSVEQGVVVEVVKDRGWYLFACDQAILAQSSTEVYLDETRVMITNIWKLPKGHCLIPERGAAFYDNLVVTPNGMAKGQAIVHPNKL